MSMSALSASMVSNLPLIKWFMRHPDIQVSKKKKIPKCFCSSDCCRPLLCWEECKNVLWALCSWRQCLLQKQQQSEVLWKITTNFKKVPHKIPALGPYLVNLNALTLILKPEVHEPLTLQEYSRQWEDVGARWNSNP